MKRAPPENPVYAGEPTQNRSPEAIMEHLWQDGLRGQLLTAMPGLMDPNFYQSVTLICEHTPSGAMGVVIDRINPSISAKDIFEELSIPHLPRMVGIPVHQGGPVHVDEIFIIHGPPFDWKGCLVVSPSMALSNTIDVLSAIAEGTGPQNFLIFLGCAGWGGGQLESELRQNAWLTCPADEEIVFNVPAQERWQAAMTKMGIDPALLSNMPGHA
jgi:putative transcriptional regulator